MSVTVRPMAFDATVPERVGDGLLRADDVVVEPRHQRAGLRAGEERQRQPLHVVEQRDPHVVDEALADAGREVPLRQAEDGVGEGEADGGAAQDPDQGPVLVGDGGVEEAPEQQRLDRGHDGVEDDADEERDQDRPVGPGQLQHATEQGPLDLAALHGVGVTPETHHRLVCLHESLIPSDPAPT